MGNSLNNFHIWGCFMCFSLHNVGFMSHSHSDVHCVSYCYAQHMMLVPNKCYFLTYSTLSFDNCSIVWHLPCWLVSLQNWLYVYGCLTYCLLANLPNKPGTNPGSGSVDHPTTRLWTSWSSGWACVTSGSLALLTAIIGTSLGSGLFSLLACLLLLSV